MSDTLLQIWNDLMPQQKALYGTQADGTAAVARLQLSAQSESVHHARDIINRAIQPHESRWSTTVVANGPYKPTDTTDAAAPAQSSYTFKRASWEQAERHMQ